MHVIRVQKRPQTNVSGLGPFDMILQIDRQEVTAPLWNVLDTMSSCWALERRTKFTA